MKTTMMFRPIANPRRTTLAHLKDAEPARETEQDTQTAESAETAETASAGTDTGTEIDAIARIRPLPQQTANPKRTVLTKLPVRN
jgi:hypothetical protein